MTALIASSGVKALTVVGRGSCPNSFLARRFGHPTDMRTLFDAPGYSGVKLRVTNGGAGGSGRVVIQELRR